LHEREIHTTAGIPSPADAHFLMHCCKVSIPFCSMPLAMLAPSVTWPVGASTTAVQNITHRLDYSTSGTEKKRETTW